MIYFLAMQRNRQKHSDILKCIIKQKVSARNSLSCLGFIAKLSLNSDYPKNFLPNSNSSKKFWQHYCRVAPLFHLFIEHGQVSVAMV